MALSRSALVFAMSMAACSYEHDSSSVARVMAESDTAAAVFVVGQEVGERRSRELAVSGHDRLSVPDTRYWTCGEAPRGTVTSNVARVELSNPGDETVSASLKLEGLAETYPKLYVYRSKSAPLRECLTFGGRELSGASSVILEPASSAFVVISAGSVTGVYTLDVTTDHVLPP